MKKIIYTLVVALMLQTIPVQAMLATRLQGYIAAGRNALAQYYGASNRSEMPQGSQALLNTNNQAIILEPTTSLSINHFQTHSKRDSDENYNQNDHQNWWQQFRSYFARNITAPALSLPLVCAYATNVDTDYEDFSFTVQDFENPDKWAQLERHLSVSDQYSHYRIVQFLTENFYYLQDNPKALALLKQFAKLHFDELIDNPRAYSLIIMIANQCTQTIAQVAVDYLGENTLDDNKSYVTSLIIRLALRRNMLTGEQYIALLNSDAGRKLLNNLCKDTNDRITLDRIAIDFLATQIDKLPVGNPLNGNILCLLKRDALDWNYFVEHYPDQYLLLIESLCTTVAQFKDVRFYNTRGMLFFAPIENYTKIITALLTFYEARDDTHLSSLETLYLAQQIADLIILFDLDINVTETARDAAFAHTIIEAISDLRESYNYHKLHPVSDSGSPLRRIINAELHDERARMMSEVETKLGKNIKNDLMKGKIINSLGRACRIFLQTCDPAEFDMQQPITAVKFAEHRNASAYIYRKLVALGFAFDGRIKINSTESDSVAYISRKSEFDFQILGIAEGYMRALPLAQNIILAHEMNHYYDNHSVLSRTIFNLTEEQIASGKENPFPNDYSTSYNIFQEKFADIKACLHVGPKACSALVLPLGPKAHSVSFDTDNMPHPPWPVRVAAFAALAESMRKEDAGEQVDLSKETAFTIWLRTKNKQPDQEMYLARFYQDGRLCEDQ